MFVFLFNSKETPPAPAHLSKADQRLDQNSALKDILLHSAVPSRSPFAQESRAQPHPPTTTGTSASGSKGQLEAAETSRDMSATSANSLLSPAATHRTNVVFGPEPPPSGAHPYAAVSQTKNLVDDGKGARRNEVRAEGQDGQAELRDHGGREGKGVAERPRLSSRDGERPPFSPPRDRGKSPDRYRPHRDRERSWDRHAHRRQRDHRAHRHRSRSRDRHRRDRDAQRHWDRHAHRHRDGHHRDRRRLSPEQHFREEQHRWRRAEEGRGRGHYKHSPSLTPPPGRDRPLGHTHRADCDRKQHHWDRQSEERRAKKHKKSKKKKKTKNRDREHW